MNQVFASYRHLTIGVMVLFSLLVGCASVQAAEEPQISPAQMEMKERGAWYLHQLRKFDPELLMDWGKRVWPQPGGGDPHKYITPVIVARLLHDPTDEASLRAYRRLMIEDNAKGDKGLYHFSAYGRTRLFLALGDKLPADIVEANRKQTTDHFYIMTHGGTDNHAWMHRANATAWLGHLENPRFRGDWNEQRVKNWFTEQTQRLYHVGHGEWDSTSYIVYTAASKANVYDYATDERMRAVARAGLDWQAATRALKWFHGVSMGPESRGFAQHAVTTIERPSRNKARQEFPYDVTGMSSDWLSWYWYGGSAGNVAKPGVIVRPHRHATNSVAVINEGLTFYPDAVVHEHGLVNLATSSYAPPDLFGKLARKEVELPFSAKNSKPVYYGGRGSSGEFTGGSHINEVLYLDKNFAMGTAYHPEPGLRVTGTILPQTSMFKGSLLDRDGVCTFGMASGYHGHFPLEGRGPFDQYHQHGAAAIYVMHMDPEVEKRAVKERVRERAIFGIQDRAGQVVEEGGWYFWQVYEAFVAARPLNGEATVATPEEISITRVARSSPNYTWLVSPGRTTGWVVQVGQMPDHENFAAFRKAVLEKCKLDTSELAEKQIVSFTSLDGSVLKMRHTGGPGGKPEAWVDGEQHDFTNWPVYDSPYLKIDQQSGIMTVTDGESTYRVDFSGDTPTFEAK